VQTDPLTAARELLAEHHQPVTMTHAEIWALLATYQRRLSDLVDYCTAGHPEPPADPADRWPQGGTL
jgi:hypothetical protein